MTERENDAERQMLVQEIEEDLRREQYAKLWSVYGGWLIAAAVAVVVVVAGYQGWRHWRTQLRTDEAQRFAAAVSIPEPAGAATALGKLAGEASTDYKTLAELRRASLLAEGGDAKSAIAEYDRLAVANGVPQIYRDLAVLRSVLLQVENGDPATLEGRLQPLMSGSWRHSAQELQAMLAQRQGNAAKARDIYQRLADDLTTPSGLRARAAEMLAVLGPAPNQKG